MTVISPTFQRCLLCQGNEHHSKWGRVVKAKESEIHAGRQARGCPLQVWRVSYSRRRWPVEGGREGWMQLSSACVARRGTPCVALLCLWHLCEMARRVYKIYSKFQIPMKTNSFSPSLRAAQTLWMIMDKPFFLMSSYLLPLEDLSKRF